MSSLERNTLQKSIRNIFDFNRSTSFFLLTSFLGLVTIGFLFFKTTIFDKREIREAFEYFEAERDGYLVLKLKNRLLLDLTQRNIVVSPEILPALDSFILQGISRMDNTSRHTPWAQTYLENRIDLLSANVFKNQSISNQEDNKLWLLKKDSLTINVDLRVLFTIDSVIINCGIWPFC